MKRRKPIFFDRQIGKIKDIKVAVIGLGTRGFDMLKGEEADVAFFVFIRERHAPVAVNAMKAGRGGWKAMDAVIGK